MSRVVVVIVLLSLAACSNGAPEDTTILPTPGSSAIATTEAQESPSTPSPATVTSPDTPSTAGAGSGADACVVGQWELDTAAFETRMEAFYQGSGMEADVSITGGRVLLDVGREGIYAGGYDGLTVEVVADEGLPGFTITFGGVVSGEYSLDGDELVLIPDDQSTFSASVEVAGVSVTPTGELGLDDVDLFTESVSTVICDGRRMTIQPESEVVSVSDWVRR